MNKNILWGVVVLIIVIVGGVFYSNKNSKASSSEKETVKIGVIMPLTGDAGAYGEPARNAVQLAVQEINKNGGVNGRQIEAIYEDDKCSGKDSATAAQKLVNIDKVKYVIGSICSGATFGFEPITSASKVFAITPGASAPKLAGISPFLMRNNPNDNIPGVMLADYLSKTYKKVAVISEKTDYSQGLKNVFIQQAQKDGLSVVATEDYDTGTADFRTIVSKIKASNAEVIFINPQTGANAVRIASQIRQLGLKSQLVSAAFSDDATIGAGEMMNGMFMAVPPGLSTEGKGPEFLANYKKVYGAEPTYKFYSGAAYDDVYLISQAVTNVGDDTTKVAEYLHGLKSYTGTIGTYSFGQDGDLVGITSILQKIVNGKLIDLN